MPAVIAAGLLTGCTPTEYHGHDSGIDGELWRRIASFEDPLSSALYGPQDPTIKERHRIAPDLYPPPEDDPAVYLGGLDAPRWDGSGKSVTSLGLGDGGAILYDVATTASTARFSVFIASGPRSQGPTDEGRPYSGPSEVYTCYSYVVRFAAGQTPTAEKTRFAECPPPLVDELADDAVFASAEVFDG
ncbi:hypothetical protein N1028_05995 [Herbiconiux sp. CPCC 203407]|uniref:Uncharacterized protein n=1 Tax=Herbiconiux oxytropis TaxID=2970915 RepID=A0AA41XFW2_9MICO|nr:hypothetical protein [Herbiconiux oxytropis]MCS5723900.1 hypothetical protein [Herbiconiux oxytropis]MCS5725444.1 hypothetical protein [Herbiconiux oxytropis]